MAKAVSYGLLVAAGICLGILIGERNEQGGQGAEAEQYHRACRGMSHGDYYVVHHNDAWHCFVRVHRFPVRYSHQVLILN